MKEFFKYTLATVTGILLTTLLLFLILAGVIGAMVSSVEKTVVVENNSMLMLKLDHQIVDRAPNDPFSGFSKKFNMFRCPFTYCIRK